MKNISAFKKFLIILSFTTYPTRIEHFSEAALLTFTSAHALG